MPFEKILFVPCEPTEVSVYDVNEDKMKKGTCIGHNVYHLTRNDYPRGIVGAMKVCEGHWIVIDPEVRIA